MLAELTFVGFRTFLSPTGLPVRSALYALPGALSEAPLPKAPLRYWGDMHPLPPVGVAQQVVGLYVMPPGCGVDGDWV